MKRRVHRGAWWRGDVPAGGEGAAPGVPVVGFLRGGQFDGRASIERKQAASAFVKGFGCRPDERRAAGAAGRRPKASKGGNCAGGTCSGTAFAMGICVLRVWC